MKIFLLKQNTYAGYDENSGFVIEAENESQAQAMANEKCSGEGQIWDLPAHTSCKMIGSGISTKPIIHLISFNAG